MKQLIVTLRVTTDMPKVAVVKNVNKVVASVGEVITCTINVTSYGPVVVS